MIFSQLHSSFADHLYDVLRLEHLCFAHSMCRVCIWCFSTWICLVLLQNIASGVYLKYCVFRVISCRCGGQLLIERCLLLDAVGGGGSQFDWAVQDMGHSSAQRWTCQSICPVSWVWAFLQLKNYAKKKNYVFDYKGFGLGQLIS